MKILTIVDNLWPKFTYIFWVKCFDSEKKLKKISRKKFTDIAPAGVERQFQLMSRITKSTITSALWRLQNNSLRTLATVLGVFNQQEGELAKGLTFLEEFSISLMNPDE